jgi:hypothetical protein
MKYMKSMPIDTRSNISPLGLKNNSHPLINHEEHGVFGYTEKDGIKNQAVYEISSGKMFVSDDGVVRRGGREIQDTSEIKDKKLRKHFENQLPKIKAYRDALIDHASSSNYRDSAEGRRTVNRAFWHGIFGETPDGKTDYELK